MMILRGSPASPFVRKVRLAASVLGLEREITIEPADTMSASDTVRQQNPLGKIPALIIEDGGVLFDSRVILEYLDHRAGGGRIVPKDASARFAALRLQALADGMMDASILTVYESRWRPAEKHEAKWLEHQAGKVTRALVGARGGAAGARHAAQCRSHRARLRARLSRLPVSGNVAGKPSAAGRVARRFCRARSGLRGEQAGGLNARSRRSDRRRTAMPRSQAPGHFLACVLNAIRTASSRRRGTRSHRTRPRRSASARS